MKRHCIATVDRPSLRRRAVAGAAAVAAFGVAFGYAAGAQQTAARRKPSGRRPRTRRRAR